MKRIATVLVAALMSMSFATVVLAEEKTETPAAEKTAPKKEMKAKTAKKGAKKEDGKKADVKPAKKGKKEVAGC